MMIFKDRNIPMDGDLALKDALLFPLQNKLARKELLFGALFFIIPPIGWIVNMGYRMNLVNSHHHGQPLWPAWKNWPNIIKNGLVGALAFFVYMGTGVLIAALSFYNGSMIGVIIGTILAMFGTFLIPGFMTFYCVDFDIREVFNFPKAIKRIRIGFRKYLKAWGIVLISASLSTLGLLFFGVGFFITTVWNWQVAAYCFCNVFKGINIET